MTEHESQSGEPGHQGWDRQANKSIKTAAQRAPEPRQAATPYQARRRSRRPLPTPPFLSPDHLHPGPTREESEKSLGNVHHQQHEAQPDMLEEFEDL